MAAGFSIQLHSAAGAPLTSQTGLTVIWWDTAKPIDFTFQTGKLSAATTDASGYLTVDLSDVSSLSVGGKGYLLVRKSDGTNSNDSPVFQSVVTVSDVGAGKQKLVYHSGWVRPSDWLALPTVGATEEKFVGLFAVYNTDAAGVALSAAGNFTVDWGDGVIENFSANATASHTYSYAAISNSTLSASGYKQVVVTLTPQAEQTLSMLNLTAAPDVVPSGQARSVPWLEISLGSPSLTSLRIGCSVYPADASVPPVRLRHIEQVTIKSHAVTRFDRMFQNLSALESVPLFDTSIVVNMNGMFFNCGSLRTVPKFNTSAVTNMGIMFSACSSLRYIPLLDTSAVTSMTQMFQSCAALDFVPQLNVSSVTTMNSMFGGCYSLRRVPDMNTSVLVDMNSMFANCYSLQYAPAMNTSTVTVCSSAFQNCYALQRIPAMNFNAVTSATNTYSGSSSISRIDATGMKVSFSIANCNLSAAELDKVYTNLATVTGQTITVTGNRGTAGHNPSIATAKGWTVTV